MSRSGSFLPLRPGIYGLAIIGLWGQLLIAAAGHASHAPDSPLQSWANEFVKGNADSVLAGVEADLKKENFEPNAPDIWVTVAEIQGNLASRWERQTDPQIRRALGTLPEVYLLFEQRRYRELLDKYPAEKAGGSAEFWPLFYLSVAAHQQSREGDRITYALRMAQLRPASFVAAKQLYLAVESDARLHSRVASSCAASGPLANSEIAEVLQKLLVSVPAGDNQALDAIESWLAHHPTDDSALRFKALWLGKRERYEDQARALSASIAIRPYEESDWTGEAEALLRRHDEAKAFALIEQAAHLFHRAPEDPSTAVERFKAAVFVNLGEKGKARSVLAAAIQRWPNDSALQLALAELELKTGRGGSAVVLTTQAASLKPDDYDTQLTHMKAFKSAGQLAEALQVSKQIDAHFTAKDKSFYSETSDILGALRAVDERIALCERAIREFPESSWMLRAYAEALESAGRTNDALFQLEKSFPMYPPDSRSIELFRKLHTKLSGTASAETAAADLRKRFPASEALWEDANDRSQGPDKNEKRIAVWHEAIKANPHLEWSWQGLISVYLDTQRWTDAAQAIDGMAAAVKNGTRDDTGSVVFQRIRLAITRLRTEKMSDKELKDVFDAFEEFRTLGGLEGAYHQYRSELFAALGDYEKATEELLAALDLRPDTRYLIFNLFEERFSQTLGIGRSFARLRNYMDRDPYDGERLLFGAEKHVQWGGSPIVALQLLELAKQRAPDIFRKREGSDLEAKAYGSLGDHERHFRAAYGSATSIADSDRYLQWYESARRSAQTSSSQVHVDFESGVATIVHPDGQIEQRQDHPVSGKRALIQVGAAFIRCSYDPEGNNLTGLNASSGAEIRLSYYPNDTIERIWVKGGDEIFFKYNAAKKPVLISLKGVGDITVQYNEKNETKVDSSAGQVVARHVTSVLRELTDLIDPFRDRGDATVPDLPHRDPVLDQLRMDYESKRTNATANEGPATDAALKLAAYLVTHRADQRDNASDAQAISEQIFAEVKDSKSDALTKAALKSISLWHSIVTSTKKEGVPAKDWNQWNTMLAWLDSLAAKNGSMRPEQQELRRTIEERPVEILKAAAWLPRSYIDNPGFWKRYWPSALIPPPLRASAKLQSILARRNGDVVVGGTSGLNVLRRGYWEWFGFDGATSRFSPTLPHSEVKATSDVICLAEDAKGSLWMGTGDGLVHLPGDYAEPAKSWRLPQDGITAPRVEFLASYQEGVLLGSQGGLLYFGANGLIPLTLPGWKSAPVTLLQSFLLQPSEGQPSIPVVLIGTPAALYALSNNTLTKITDGRVEAASYSATDGKLYLLRNTELSACSWNSRDRFGPPVYVRGQKDIVRSQKIFGLASVPIEQDVTALAVLTDQGLSLFHDNHFEYKRLGLTDEPAAVLQLSSSNGSTFMLSPDGVFALERGRIVNQPGPRVYDLLTVDDWGITLVARGNGLEQIKREDAARGPEPVPANINPTHLAWDSRGALIANSGESVVRLDKNLDKIEPLFELHQTLPEGRSQATLTSLLVASDGTIWATAGGSVFRWRDDESPHHFAGEDRDSLAPAQKHARGTLQEFSIFNDPASFPARSDMISRVVETIDGEIWVIASNEGHRTFKGMQLSGGVLQWIGTGFRRLGLREESPAWFITGYTAIDRQRAVIGTTHGFAVQEGNRYGTFTDHKDSSYRALNDRTPLLWLGSRGARLGSDLWLFGTAGGVVAYDGGRWFYPDRLNWMLPDQYLSQYGGRTVHAIATDKAGNVYAGTDRGLLIYNSGGGDPASFLVSNGLDQMAFSSSQENKLQEETSILVPALKKESNLAKQAQQVADSRQRIELLKGQLAPDIKLSNDASKPVEPAAAEPSIEKDDLTKKLAAEQQSQAALLLRLEREHYGLFQMLEVKPLDLASKKLRSDLLKEDEALLQYLPTEKKLYINLVTRDRVEVREVNVSAADLLSRAKSAAEKLYLSSRVPALSDQLRSELEWLYDQLLRPAESSILGRSHVFIVPTGRLTYLPFAALVRRSVPRVEYAGEQFTFGYLPTMYLLDLGLRHQPSRNSDVLALGDPDGTLKGARDEAQMVHDLLGSLLEPCLGANASLEKLTTLAPKASIVHFATHAKLDAAAPDQSFILLANKQPLRVAEVMELPLADTDLVVLSACETAIGSKGMEYATLARAFALAGAPKLVATLWAVDDQNSYDLMQRFYKHLKESNDTFKALAEAQREMLGGSANQRSPGAWAAYIPLGKP